MSKSKGARLYLKPGGRDRQAMWIIRDGGRRIGTGCAQGEIEAAEEKLAEYIGAKRQVPRTNKRHPSEILIADSLMIYCIDIVENQKNPGESKSRLAAITDFSGTDTLSAINGKWCRAYVKWRTKQDRKACRPDVTGKPALKVTIATARRELEDLRAAINYHRSEGYCSEIVSVTLPEKAKGRDVWLTRSQAAALLWAAWRARQTTADGTVTLRETGKHVARFILVGLYTGTRHAAITGAALQPAIGRGYVDLEDGLFHRRAAEAVETNKRQPSVRIPDRLLAHLRRWERKGISKHAVVEWNGRPVESVRKGFAAAVKAAGLPTAGPDRIVPHVLRHTAATWGMKNVKHAHEVYALADYLGMSYAMLTERYGHHCPTLQKGAAMAIAARPGASSKVSAS